MAWYVDIRPHIDNTHFKLEIFNEIMIMIMFYMMVLFSKFNTNPDTFFAFGNAYLIFIAIVLVVNIGLMIK